MLSPELEWLISPRSSVNLTYTWGEYDRDETRVFVSDPERTIDVAWAQQELNLTSRLRITGGLRYDHYSDFGDEWSPKADVVFTLAPEQRLRGSYGHGFRPPYFGELYLDTPPFFVGNPELVPEESDGYTAGYTFAGRTAQLSLDGYHTSV